MQYIRFPTLYASTAAEKAQDMAGVGVTMAAWEYCSKWSEKTRRQPRLA